MAMFSALRRASDSTTASGASRLSQKIKAKAKRAITTVTKTVKGVVCGAQHHKAAKIAAVPRPPHHHHHHHHHPEEEAPPGMSGSEELSPLEIQRIEAEFWAALRLVEERQRTWHDVPAEDDSSVATSEGEGQEEEVILSPRPSRPDAIQAFLDEWN